MKSIKVALACALALGCCNGMSAEEHLKSLNPGYIDNDVKAGDNFYLHVNKGWMDANPLTPEYSRYSQFDKARRAGTRPRERHRDRSRRHQSRTRHRSLQGSHNLPAGHGLGAP